jgi:hypothetical protein
MFGASDGSVLFHKMTNTDVEVMFACLQSVPAVEKDVSAPQALASK